MVLANARMLGASPRQLLRHVPAQRDGLGLQLAAQQRGLAFVGAVVGEYLEPSQGVGYLILQAEGSFDINTVMAGIVLLTAFALVLDAAVTLHRDAADEVAAEEQRDRSSEPAPQVQPVQVQARTRDLPRAGPRRLPSPCSGAPAATRRW